MTAAPADPPGRKPGRPLDAEIGEKVRQAALDEVAANGAAGVNLGAVARRAGVAKSTVYARWSTTQELLADMVVDSVDLGPVPDLGDLRSDLEAVSRSVVKAALRAPLLELHMQFWVMGAGAPSRYRDFHRTALASAAGHAQVVFERARDRGEFGADIDIEVVSSTFLGSLLIAALSKTNRKPPTRAEIAKRVDLFVTLLLSTAAQ